MTRASGFLQHFPLLLLAAMLVALGAFLAHDTPQAAQAQATPATLVSNHGQTPQGTSYGAAGFVNAQAFTTGSHTAGYTLSSIEAVVEGNTPSADQLATIRAELWSAASDGAPDAKVADLTVPSSFSAGTVSLAAPANTVLASGTAYFLMLYTTGDYDMRIDYLETGDEDSGAAAGWSISDTRYYKENNQPGGSAAWTSADNPLRITVKGSEVTPASTTTFVSNMEQTPETSRESTASRALGQGFTTGAVSGGYTLGSVAVDIGATLTETQRDTVRAALWSDDGTGGISAKLFDMTVPDTILAGTVAFAAPANTTLTASTQYYFVIYTTGNLNLQLEHTTSDDEDDASSDGWSIRNILFRSDSNAPSGNWSTTSSSLSITVTEAETSSPLDLSALTAESSTDGSAFSAMTGAEALAPAFDAETTGYRATVGNDVTHVRLTPTLADSGSSVKVNGTPVTSGSASAAIALDVGDNEITVEVTDTDSNTKDYTVTVRRVPAGSEWWATLVPETYTAGTGGVGCNNKSECDSQLSDNGFTVGSTDYHFTTLFDSNTAGAGGTFSAVPNAALQGLKFCVGSEAYSIPNSLILTLLGSGEDIGWTDGTPVSLSIGTSCAQATQSTNANLSGLTASSSTSATGTFTAFDLTPAFDADTTDYAATVANSVTHAKLTPTVDDTGKATVQVGPQGGTLDTVTDGQPSAALALNVGANAFTVRVTAEDSTTKDHTVTITRQAQGTPPPAAPGAPTVLNVSPNDGQLIFTWTAPTTGGAVTGYDVHYTSAPSTGQNAVGNEDAASGNDPSAAWVAISGRSGTFAGQVILGLTNGREYRLRVRAKNGGGASAWLHGTGTPAPQIPAMPENLRVTAGDGRLDLGWTQPNASLVTGYEVHYTSASVDDVGNDAAASGSDPSAAWVDAGHTGTTASHALTGLTNGTAYRVRVRAVNAAGNGAWARGTGTPLPADMLPAPRPMATGGVTLWSATLTVQDVGIANGQVFSRGCGNGTGKPCTTNLTEDGFRFDGTGYQFTNFSLANNDYLSFVLNKNLAGEKRRLVLVVDGQRFSGRDGTFVAGGKVQLGWQGAGLSWSAGDTVSLSLLEIPTAHLAVSPNPVAEGTQALLEVCLRRGLDVMQGDRNWRYHVPNGDVTVPVIVTPGTAEERDYGEGAAGSDGTRRYNVYITGAHQMACGTARFWTHRDGDDDDETFTAMLDTSNLPSSLVAGSPSSVEVTIKETDESEVSWVPFVRLTGPETPVVEGGSVTLTASLHIGELPTILQHDVFIPLVVQRETSEEGDHGTVHGVTIRKLQRSASVVIPTYRDGDGDDEFFTVSIGFRPTSPAQPSGRYGSVRIRIAEREPPLVSLEASPNPVHEGNTVTVTARLSQAMSTDLTLPVTVTGIDSEGGDHDGLSSITVPRGQTTGTGTIATSEDDDTDDERFTVALGSVPLPAAAVSPTSVDVTIADQTEPEPVVPTDTFGLLSISPSPAEEGGTVTLTATLENSAPSGGIVVRFLTHDGPGSNSAGADDYTLSPSTGQSSWVFQDRTPGIRIPQGQRTATATLNITADGTTEGDETLGVQLAVNFGDVQRGYTLTLTIKDSDAQSGSQNAPCDNCGTGGDTGAVDQGQGKYADLIAQMKEWRNDPEWSHLKEHTDRWDRALLAFGETVDDATLTAMTAAEAQGFADRGWERWVPVAAALRELENWAPTVSAAISDATIVNESGTQTVSLSGVFDDADGDALTITASSGDEAVATVSVSSDGSSLTVSAQARGTATVTATADDGKGGTVEDSFTVTVKAAPVVASAIADVSGLEAGSTQEVSLSGVFDDADGDALTITAASSDETRVTVTLASDGASLTITGVAGGTATVTVTAQDSDGNRVSDAFEAPVGKYAALIAQMYQWREDPQWRHQKSHTDRWDRALLAFGETVADSSLTPMTAAEAQALADQDWGVRWVPVAAALWEIEGGGQQETPNAAPTVSAAISDATIVNQTGTQTVSLSGVFDDADGDSLTITAASSDEAIATVSVAADYATLTVNAQARGAATITVTAADGNGGTAEDAFTVTVKAAPDVASDIADVTGLEAGSTREVSLSGVFTDADGDALSVTASSDDEAVATVTVSADHSALTLTGVAEGTATVTVIAQDSDGNPVIDDFAVTVVAQQQQPPQAPPNEAPTVTAAISDATIVNESGTQTVSLGGVFSDADGDSLTITAASSDEAKATVSVAGDYSSLTVNAQARGTAVITVTAADGEGGTVSDAFTVTVKAAPAVASAIADMDLKAGATQDEGGVRDVTLSAVFSDADGDSLTFTADTSDFAIAEALLFQGILTVVGLADGSATITVTAQDADGNTVSDTFDVKVVGPPTPASNLSCVAQTGRVLFSWDAPQWSGAELYAYDYDLTLPDGRREQSRLQGYPAVSGKGEYQAGQQASISVKAVYELADGSEVSSEAVSLSCTVAE